MADDDFSLDGDSSNVEASLDDFFQPAAGPDAQPKEAAPSRPSPPVDIFEPGLSPSEPPPPPVSEPEPAAEGEKRIRKIFSTKLLIIIVAVLGVAVLGAAGYFAYSFFFAKDAEPDQPAVVKTAPPVPIKKPAKVEEPVDKKVATEKPADKAADSAKDDSVTKAAPTPKKKPKKKPLKDKASTAEPEPDVKEPVKAKEPAKEPFKPPAKEPVKTAAISKGPYTIQVGSYMMEASMDGPEKSLSRLGFMDFHYVDINRTLNVYDVFVGGLMTKAEAGKVKSDLEGLGYEPTLKKEKLDTYRVLAYSYGSKTVANKTKSNIEKAGIGNVEIKSGRRKVTLHQLRVGHYASKTDAQKDMSSLRKAGFDTILIKE